MKAKDPLWTALTLVLAVALFFLLQPPLQSFFILGLVGMAVASYGVSISLGGISIQKSITRSFDHPNPYEVSLPAGTAGTLTTRTDDDTGDITLSAGHGLTSGTYDVFWSGGVQYGCTGTVVDNTLSIDAGSGDNLPAQDTAVVVCEQVPINTAIDGDAISLLAIVAEFNTTGSTDPVHIQFQESGSAEIAELDLVANEPQVYDIEGGVTNPFTGNPIVIAYASQGGTTETATLKIASGEDATP